MKNIIKSFKTHLCLISVFIILLIKVDSLLLAQESNDPCGCNAVLMDGIYNSRVMRGDMSAASDHNNYVANMDYLAYKKAYQVGGGVSYGLLGLNGNESESEFKQKQNEFKRIHQTSEVIKSTKELLERYGDRGVFQAWENCKASCKTQGVLVHWVEIMDANKMVLHIKWNPNTPINPKVKDSYISGAIAPMNTDQNKVLPYGTEILISDKIIPIERSNPKNPIQIIISLEGSTKDVSEYIPSYVTPIEPVIIVKNATTEDYDGNRTGYVTLTNPQYPGVATHDPAFQPGVPNNLGWTIGIPAAGRYKLLVCYASDKSSSITIKVDDRTVFMNKLTRVTGGLGAANARWFDEGILDLPQGRVSINLYKEQGSGPTPIPHIKGIKLILLQ